MHVLASAEVCLRFDVFMGELRVYKCEIVLIGQ